MTKINSNNNNVYIQSLEASDIMAHMLRGNYIKSDYSGMLPYSLHLIELHKQGLSTFTSQFNEDIVRSKDVINVKFKSGLRSLVKTINDNNKIIETKEIVTESDEEYIQNLKEYTEQLEEELETNGDDPKWETIKRNELREKLYREGFTITNYDGSQDTYKLYIRSSSKSRNGECLFIHERLHASMTTYNRMGLDIPKDTTIGIPSLRSYESLIGSSIENTISINPDNILVIDDVKSVFTQKANVVKMDNNGELYTEYEDTEIANDIWDGQSLLDSRYFDGEGMKLLRNHFTKSCAFNTNITEFYRDKAREKGIDYDEWTVKDMFGNEMYVSDIHMITTPNSLKFLNFSYLVGTEKEMYEYWKDIVKADGCQFGVCFSEQQTSHMIEGTPHRELSYQIINSLGATREDIKKLVDFEMDYLDKLKNDDDVFAQYLQETANDQNSNQAFAEIYQKNPKIMNTRPLKELRKRLIHGHVNKCRRGNIRIPNADYLVMCGDGLSMIYATIDEFDVDKSERYLEANQIHTTMFSDGEKLAGFRNPHTSQANNWYLENKRIDEIDRYFNSTDNIAHITSRNVDTLDRLSGSDFDSDDVWVSSNPTLVKLAKNCFENYSVVVNSVRNESESYQLNNYDMYQVDQDLSISTQLIGLVTNRAQLALSIYWDRLANGKSVEGLMEKIYILTCLSGLSIDLAKDKVEINIEKAVKDIQNSLQLKTDKNNNEKNPNFWVSVSQNRNTRNNTMHYDTAMDFLYDILTNDVERADSKETIEMERLLVDADHRKANRRQTRMISDLVREMQDKADSTHAKFMYANSEETKERDIVIDDIVDEYVSRLGRYKVNSNTMYDLLRRMDDSDISLRLINTLYKTQYTVFMEAFK